MADVARVVGAANLARGFKRLAPDGTVAPQPIDEAHSLVAGVIDLRLAHQAVSETAAGSQIAQIPLRAGVSAAVAGLVKTRLSEIRVAVSAGAPPARPEGEAPEPADRGLAPGSSPPRSGTVQPSQGAATSTASSTSVAPPTVA